MIIKYFANIFTKKYLTANSKRGERHQAFLPWVGVLFDCHTVVQYKRAVYEQHILTMEINEIAEQNRADITYVNDSNLGVALYKQRGKAASEGIAEYYKLLIGSRVWIFDGNKRL